MKKLIKQSVKEMMKTPMQKQQLPVKTLNYNSKFLPVAQLKKLGHSFYNRRDVVKIAKELLGKILVTTFGGVRTSGRIVETEAYAGVVDNASHAYRGRRTSRTEVMYKDAGTAYVYLCYGIHHLFNVVTNKKNIPHAVLIRSLEPLEGIETMLRRSGKKKMDHTLTRGPGNVSKALGIVTNHSGISLLGKKVFIGDDGFKVNKDSIGVTTRIGVEYAGKDADLLYRFIIKDSRYISGRRQ
ncbi:MAG TPA: DNA-3-methyladenine glycosylase [Puia sp.]|nr:DNA-3-methyladenine glycosylase [Puia sp.]